MTALSRSPALCTWRCVAVPLALGAPPPHECLWRSPRPLCYMSCPHPGRLVQFKNNDHFRNEMDAAAGGGARATALPRSLMFDHFLLAAFSPMGIGDGMVTRGQGMPRAEDCKGMHSYINVWLHSCMAAGGCTGPDWV